MTDPHSIDLEPVAEFVASNDGVQLRHYLYGLARAQQDEIIGHELGSNRRLRRYLRENGRSEDLSPVELQHCIDWGLQAAAAVAGKPLPVADAYIVARLLEDSIGASGNPGGLGG